MSIGPLFLWPETSSAQPNHSAHSIDILLVEDDQKDVKLTQRAFAQAKLANRLETVGDGAAALDYLFCRLLRAMIANDLTRAIHVVILTNSHNDAHFREAPYLGADGYIVKPIDFQNFSAVTPQLNFAWALLKQESTA